MRFFRIYDDYRLEELPEDDYEADSNAECESEDSALEEEQGTEGLLLLWNNQTLGFPSMMVRGKRSRCQGSRQVRTPRILPHHSPAFS